MTELCTYCEKRPIDVRKWKLCNTCRAELRRNGKLQNMPKYKVYHKVTYPKISNECISDMIKEGFTTAQIGRTCNISRQAVHQRVNKEKYKAYTIYHGHYEIIFLYKIGFTQQEISELIKCSKSKVAGILNQYRIKRPITIKKIVCDMYTKGETPQKIAGSLDISLQTIYAHLIKNEQYKPTHIRNKNKHIFEVNFLRRLGYTIDEIHKYTKLSKMYISSVSEQKFKKLTSYYGNKYTQKVRKYPYAQNQRMVSVNFLRRLGFNYNEIHEYTKIPLYSIGGLIHPKFKRKHK